MMDRNLRIHARREFRVNGISLHAYNDQGQQLAVAAPVTMTAADEGEMLGPMLTIGHDTAQQLMDELWNCGIRPTEGTGSAGSLAATERHLADMKALAFHALKVPR